MPWKPAAELCRLRRHDQGLTQLTYCVLVLPHLISELLDFGKISLLCRAIINQSLQLLLHRCHPVLQEFVLTLQFVLFCNKLLPLAWLLTRLLSQFVVLLNQLLHLWLELLGDDVLVALNFVVIILQQLLYLVCYLVVVAADAVQDLEQVLASIDLLLQHFFAHAFDIQFLVNLV